jgi:phage-related protein
VLEGGEGVDDGERVGIEHRLRGDYRVASIVELVDLAHNFWYSMGEVERKLEVVFFRTDMGSEPVREWLLSLAKEDRKVIGDDVLKVQYCWPIGRPLVGSLSGGLWEVRSRLGDRIARLIFCVDGRTMVLLHGFIKKTQKAPRHELALAVKRLNQLR